MNERKTGEWFLIWMVGVAVNFALMSAIALRYEETRVAGAPEIIAIMLAGQIMFTVLCIASANKQRRQYDRDS